MARINCDLPIVRKFLRGEDRDIPLIVLWLLPFGLGRVTCLWYSESL